MSSHNQEDLKVIYEKICQAHEAITEFRAKLLAALPIASGAGIFLPIGDKAPRGDQLAYLTPIGIFVALVALGLFCYELRGIQECHALRECGKRLEQKLGGELGQAGRFMAQRKSVLGVLGVRGAALIIYPAVIGAWIYVATFGFVRCAADRASCGYRSAPLQRYYL
jgi:hypothetical protein